MATALPIATLMPATGFWLMTVPAGTVVLVSKVTVTVRPTPWMAAMAAAWVEPTTLGTGTLLGGRVPEDTTKLTALPIATLMPATGFWLMTLPAGTVGLAR